MSHTIVRKLRLSDKLSSDLDNLFMSPHLFSPHFTDITIRAWERGKPVEWRAHSAVLVARSDWWRACLTHNMRERNTGIVEVHQTPAHILRLLVRYLYGGVIELVPETAMGVLVASNMYNEMELLSECVSYLKDTITVDHALDLLAAARKHDQPELAEAALEFVRDNGEDCFKSEGLLFAREELLLELLDDDAFDCPEIEVFHAIVRWARANRGSSSMSEVVAELFEHVRFALIPSDVLRDVVEPTGCVCVWVRFSSHCLVFSSLSFSLAADSFLVNCFSPRL